MTIGALSSISSRRHGYATRQRQSHASLMVDAIVTVMRGQSTA